LEALYNNTTGSYNTAVGINALTGTSSATSNVTGHHNTAIGNRAGVASSNLSNTTAIGDSAIVSASNTIQLGSVSVTNVNTSGTITSPRIAAGTLSPTSSAVLEASSTTQGFLPPRMTKAQRDAIASPVSGLMIWCTDNLGGEIEVYNGSIWLNMSGFTNSTLSIGNYYQGGKIAYILVSGDPGYDETTQHGLIAATTDQSTGIRWHNGSNTTTGATATTIGTGLSNTNTIIGFQGAVSRSYAAGLARAFTGGGYNDWYLPSKDELNKLYLNRVAIGGFTSNSYWSSTESSISNGDASSQVFLNGNQSNSVKFGTNYVRAIRAF